eukprot:TRINITY_DN1319_c0_g3_i1.p1 TRINITY_DN1319_c0_g3~~TRINITY_DN1319_c0_g3_i1.p1  ORF type:complete len:349 (+),score=97.67 TRINITY_DN1319_c0_g3_i1:46-1047(+)
MAVAEPQVGKRELYTYTAPWLVYAMNWSVRPDKPFRLAIGSFVEDFTNKIQVVELHKQRDVFEASAEFDHPYPATKVMWIPDKQAHSPDLLATSGDCLRVWEVSPTGSVSLKAGLSTAKQSEFCAPLTSFDWNEANPDILGTSSIDTTCTIWSLETQKVKTQLIAHDKEVYDIAFRGNSTDMFASVGADGSVRMFDLRALEHSTIVYESAKCVPLLRLSWNKQDTNYIATFAMNSTKVTILDTRYPATPVAELQGHTGTVNSLSWAPHSSCHLCTGGEDKQALIWDISSLPSAVEFPILQYEAELEINQLHWSACQPEWIGAAVGNKLQTLRV